MPRRVVLTLLLAGAAACGLSVTGASTGGDGSTSSTSSTSSSGSSSSTSSASSGGSSSSGEPDAGPLLDGAPDAAVCIDPVLRFNGTTDFALVPDSTELDLPGPFTVEAWIRPTVTTAGGGEMHIVSHHNHDGNTGWALLLKDGRLELRIYVAPSANSPQIAGNEVGPNVVGNVWSFVAGTWDGTKLRVYMDGKFLDEEEVLLSRNDYRGGLVIGRAAYSTTLFHFEGDIDEVRLSNVARYTGTVADMPATKLQPDASTVALWRFDEAPSANGAFANAAGPKHGGTLRGGARSVAAECVDKR